MGPHALEDFPAAIPVTRLNHISLNCCNVKASLQFYRGVLGFSQIKRPGSFDFDGAWLFNYGMGIHLLKDDNKVPRKCGDINPRSEHISFQCCDMEEVQRSLFEHSVKYKRQQVEEGGILVDQLFFHDPDGHMIEVCNCDALPVVLLEAASGAGQQQLQACPCLTSASSVEDSSASSQGVISSHDTATGAPAESLRQGHESGPHLLATGSHRDVSGAAVTGGATGNRSSDDAPLERRPKEKVLEASVQATDSQGPILPPDPLLSTVLKTSAQFADGKRKRGEFAICA